MENDWPRTETGREIDCNTALTWALEAKRKRGRTKTT